MKKFLSIIIIFISFLIIYFLQANFFNWFNIAGVKPNLFIILLLFVGMYMGKAYGLGIGITLGLLIDFFIGKAIGINGIILGLAGILGGVLTKSFSKDSRLTIMLIVMGTTCVCEIISYILHIIAFGLNIEILRFLKIIFIEVVFNTILVIIIYPILRIFGDKVEKVFSEKKILTRYF